MDQIDKWITQQAKQPSAPSGSRKSLSRQEEDRLERQRLRAMRRQSERADETKRQQWQAHRRKLAQLPPDEIAQQVDNRCQYCDNLLVPTVTQQEVVGFVRPVIIWPDYCGCERGKMAINRAKRNKQIDRDKIQRDLYQAHLKKAGLVGWLADATFDTFTDRHDWDGAAECKARVSRYIDMLFLGKRERKNWLILHGNFGTGKSHLAAAIIHEAIDRNWREVYFRVWPEYLKRLQMTWDKNKIDGETEADVIRELQQGLIVVIDDLDKSQATEWTKSTLYSALNHRYNAEKPVILTFNYGPGDAAPKAPGRLALEDYLGRAVLDRVLEVSYDVIEFGGSSSRSGGKWNVK